MGSRTKPEQWLDLAEDFQNKLNKDKPWIKIDKSTYRGVANTLTYHCEKHNITLQVTGAAILKSYGCPSCQQEYHTYRSDGYKKSRSILEFDKFKAKAKEIHGDKYNYDCSDYLNSSTKIKIFCNKHESYFYQLPSAHIQGQNCPECGKESFANNAGIGDEGFERRWLSQNKNPNLFYVKGSFTKFGNSVKFTCLLHGEFSTKNYSKLENVCSGCLKEDRRNSFEEKFIEKSSKLYPDCFDYSKVRYIDNTTKVILTCKHHGDFEVIPMHHVSEKGHGSGCKECAKLLWGRWSPKVLKKNEDYFRKEVCVVYLIKLGDLYKIGISKNIKSRFSQLRLESGLEPVLIGLYQSNTYKSSEIEHHLSNIYKTKRTDHPINFGGYTECYDFSEQDITDILSFFIQADSW